MVPSLKETFILNTLIAFHRRLKYNKWITNTTVKCVDVKKNSRINMLLTLSRKYLRVGAKFKALLKHRGKQCTIKSRQALEVAPPFVSVINLDKLLSLSKLWFPHLEKKYKYLP